MAEWVKEPTSKPASLSLISSAHWWKEKTNSPTERSSDLHTWLSPPNKHNVIKKKTKFKNIINEAKIWPAFSNLVNYPEVVTLCLLGMHLSIELFDIFWYVYMCP